MEIKKSKNLPATKVDAARSYVHRLRFEVILGVHCTLKIQSYADGTRAAASARVWIRCTRNRFFHRQCTPESRSVRSAACS